MDLAKPLLIWGMSHESFDFGSAMPVAVPLGLAKGDETAGFGPESVTAYSALRGTHDECCLTLTARTGKRLTLDFQVSPP